MMTSFKKLLLALALSVTTSVAAYAEDFVKGKVKKVNPDKGKVTVIHEEIPNLEMPAMTMVFRTNGEDMIKNLAPGQDIEFVAERVNGKLTITKIKE